MSEWLEQYTEVSQKQQDYLSRIHELRRGLQQNGDKHVLAAIDKLRMEQKEKYRWKFPPYPATRTRGSAHSPCLDPFPCRPCLFHCSEQSTQSTDKRVPKLNMAPNITPRRLAPIVKSVNTKFTVTKDNNNIHQVTPRPEMLTMRTEYESFESIAKRNKLNLTQFFNSSLSHRRSYRRLPMSIPTVSIMEEDPVVNTEQKAFITDVSSKKSLVRN